MTFSTRIQRALPWAYLTLAAIACLSLYRRLYLGVSLADEPFYSALSYRFSLGDRPFVDEWFLAQTTALLNYPIFGLYTRIFGTTGIVLFARHLYFLLVTLCVYALFKVFQRRIGNRASILCASLLWLYIPHNLPTIDFNTVSASLFVLGIIVAMLTYKHGQASWFFSAIGGLHAFATYAYPPLFLAALLFPIIWLTPYEKRGARAVGYCVGYSVMLALILVWAGAGVETYKQLFARTAVLMGGMSFNLVKPAMQFATKNWIICVFLGVCFLLRNHRIFRQQRNWVMLVFIAFVFGFSRASRGGGGSNDFVVFATLGALILYWESAFVRRMLIPAVIVGIFIESMAIPLGIGLCLFAYAAIRSEPKIPGAIVVLVLFVAMLRFLQGVQGEGFSEPLNARVESGPYFGLYTTQTKKDYLHQIEAQLKHNLQGAKKIIFYPHFPGGYLMTPLRPASPAVWETCPIPLMTSCRAYVDDHLGEGDLVVRVNKLYHSKDRIAKDIPGSHPVDSLLLRSSLLWQNENFALYRYKGR